MRTYIPFARLIALFISSSLIGCANKNQISFGSSVLKNAAIQTPTSLQFGPDGRLYISQQNGIIKIFTIRKNGPNDYTVVSTEVIDLINKMPNHDDNGLLNTAIKKRVTGINLIRMNEGCFIKDKITSKLPGWLQ